MTTTIEIGTVEAVGGNGGNGAGTEPAGVARARVRGAVLKAALAALAREAPATAKAPRGNGDVDKALAALESGIWERAGGRKFKMSLTQTATCIAKVVKWGAGDRVPEAARTRFPWGVFRRETLDAVAEAVGANPDAFARALTPTVAATAVEPVAEAAAVETAEPAAEPARRSRRR